MNGTFETSEWQLRNNEMNKKKKCCEGQRVTSERVSVFPQNSLPLNSNMARGPMITEVTTSIFQGLFQLFLRAKYTTKNKFASQKESIAASTATDTLDKEADPLAFVQVDSPNEESNSGGHSAGFAEPKKYRIKSSWKMAAYRTW
jgi:hypothetical protein